MARSRGYSIKLPGALTYALAMYFCYYLALGAFLPYINLYYERIGFSGVQIGMLAALPLLVGSLTSLFWGAISDAFHLHGRILSLALLFAPMAVLMMAQASSYYAIIPYVVAFAVMSSPIIPLLDSTALEVARTQQRSYGGLRAWGTIGWSISSLLVGALIQEFNLRIFFYCYAVLMGLTFLLSLFQPARITVLRSPFGQGLRRLMHLEIIIFLVSIFLLSVTLNAVNSFFSIYFYGLGAGEGMIGLAWALVAVGEVPLMIFSGRIMRRIGASGLLKVAFITFALRWLLFSFIDSPTWVLIVQPLYGLAFAAFWVGGVTYLNARTPEGLSTTTQAIFNAVAFGLGAIIGALLGGILYDTVGMVNLFRILTLVAIAGIAIFWLGNRTTSEVTVGMKLGES